MCTANMEDESAGAENINGKDKNPYKISVETPKRKIPLQVCSQVEGQMNERQTECESLKRIHFAQNVAC